VVECRQRLDDFLRRSRKHDFPGVLDDLIDSHAIRVRPRWDAVLHRFASVVEF